ncbi:hypothetical protein DH09_08125 [Bacillaceae bacterium JMAK1]|nr:hypothetical protein DH09_08125 [Bacillaceae bacterium JMAK1]
MLLSEVWSAYRYEKVIENYSDKTIKEYAYRWRAFVLFNGDVLIDDVMTNNIKAFVLDLSKRCKPSTVAAYIRAVRSIFRWVHEEGFINKNVAVYIREPKQGKRVPKDLSKEDVERMRIACKTPKEHALFEFFYSAGCRISEVQSLNKEQFNFETRTVVVHGKGDQERIVMFSRRAAFWIKEYFSTRKGTDPAFILTDRMPRRMGKDRIRGIFKELAQRAGIEKEVYPHRLRHTFATHMLESGVPLQDVSKFLGHAKIETTQIYTTVTIEHLRKSHEICF